MPGAALRVVLLSLALLTTTSAWIPLGGADPNPDWGKLSFQDSGLAGDWVFAYHPFSPDVTEFDARIDFQFEVAAGPDPITVMTMRPELVELSDGELSASFMEPEVAVLPVGETVAASWHGHYSAGIGGASFGGLMFLVAADAPWTLNVTIARDEGGPDAMPELVTAGSGLVVVHGEDDSLDAPVDPAGSVSLDATVSAAGWSHLQVLFSPIQPDGVRKYDFLFPSGADWDGFGYGYGFQAVVIGSSSRSNKIDFAGEMLDPAGDIHAEVTYAEATYDIELVLAHLPGFTAAALPPNFVGTAYLGFSDPFYDGLVPLP